VKKSFKVTGLSNETDRSEDCLINDIDNKSDINNNGNDIVSVLTVNVSQLLIDPII
jgi:hypothetical protein